ncbi:MAG: translation initiation factor 2 [Porcipelethomonas sp.]
MKGIHHVEISNRDARFKFDLNRNITIIRGKSGTGKTTMFDMISDFTRFGEASGVNVSCDKNCVALTDIDWKNQLSNTSDSIVFIDEGVEYLNTKEFAKAIKNTDNYYVIFNRENLRELPYSVEEIYEIKVSGRFHSLKKMYKSNARHFYYKDSAGGKLKYDILLTEDSKSGLQFYKSYFQDSDIECISSESNSAVFKWINEHKDKKVLVIADGAAFGSEIDRVLKLQTTSNFKLCLPESFEWLILKSGLIRTNDINNMLENTADYVESADFFSWENFFEDYLIQNTVNTPFQYAKREINQVYLNSVNAQKIMEEIDPEE